MAVYLEEVKELTDLIKIEVKTNTLTGQHLNCANEVVRTQCVWYENCPGGV